MANSGIPTALVGAIYHAIDGQPAVEAVRFSFSFSRPLKQRYGFQGLIGTQRGQAGSRKVRRDLKRVAHPVPGRAGVHARHGARGGDVSGSAGA